MLSFRFTHLLSLGAALVLTAASLQAQAIQSSILGNVRDSSGAGVPAATVTVVNEGTGEKRTQTTDSAGDYRFSGLLGGTYTVSITANGFKTYTEKSIHLDMSQIKRVDADLEVGDLTSTVTVEGGSVSQVATETATLSNIKTSRDFAEMPMSIYGRSWINVLQVTAGVQSVSGVEVNGARDTANNFTADGISVNDVISSRQTANGFSGDIESFEEMKIMTANNSPEYAQVAQFAAVSKSGTNQVHGGVFWGNYNNYLSARNWQDSAGPSFENHNMFSLNNGGPVYIPKLYDGRNKTFYFFSYGGARYRTGARTWTSVPTEAFRNGDFSSLLGTVQLVDPLNGQPFPENKLPASRISSVSRSVQDIIYPSPNLPGEGDLGLINNYYADPGGKFDADNVSTRIDQRISDSNSLFVRVGLTINNKDYWPGALKDGYGDGNWWGNHPGRSVVISDTHTFSPTVVNEVKLGFSRDYGYWFDIHHGEDVLSQIGLQGILNPGNDPAISGMPAFRIYGANGFAGTDTWANGNSQAANTYQIIDNLSWFRGRHNFKAGADIRRYQINDQSKPIDMRGAFTFDDQLSGFAYANFLLGYPTDADRALARPNAYPRSTQYGFYAQDEFKVNRRVTLTYGLRYEYQTPWVERFDRMFSFDINRASLVTAGTSIPSDLVPAVAANLPIITAQEAGFPTRSLMKTDPTNLSPRLGLAFRPFGNDQAVVRAGYGLFTQMWPGLLALNATGGPWQSTEYFFIENNVPSIQFPNPFLANSEFAGLEGVSASNPNFPRERTQQWNVSVGKQIWNTAIDVAYVGTKANNIPFSQDLNLLYPSTTPYDSARRPFQRFNNVDIAQSGASSIYHGMTVQADRRMARGLMFNVNYTWAKALTDANLNSYTSGATQNQYQRYLERGDDPNIRRQTLRFSYLYELPIGHNRALLPNVTGVLDKIVSGWQVAGITTMLTGARLDPSFSGVDPANTNQYSGRPDRVGDGNFDSGEMRDRIAAHQPIFDRSAFVLPEQGRGSYGNSARTILTGPGTVQWNIVASKNFALVPDRARLQVRCEMFNAFNRANFSNPGRDITSSGFGLVTGASAARRIQFSARIDY
ncbi:MAG: carboxypeptidase regulatory-like domain-containing protein [Acidobacteriota bacterium]